ncbi:methylenetetrahydrofolate reductase [Desulfatibacillum aliphaticivorans]|uniref:methylenetetrahydrofolate reductase n=1 Tax=Desulfatibacillum aliphaticivorans TaxID=218208 RepID=UPI00040C0CE9|nr:methylenetetrahydrofolate reductase [Desulfatibacillum aliphaticivorans]
MRVSKLYQDSQKPVISFEFFPPRDEKAGQAFDKTIDALKPLSPDFMTMTFGAGGSTKDGSYQAVKNLMGRKIPTVAYLAGFGLSPDYITQVLDRYRELGVETIFTIRGDEPREKDFQPHPDSFPYACDLIKFIASKYDFDLGCAGYPEGHIDAESLDKDIEHLKRKVDNGAKYVVCQYCYDEDFFFAYVDKCRAAGIQVPIIPGIMPVYTVKLTRMLAKICGTTIVDDMAANLDKLEGADAQAVLDYGVEFALDQCRGLLKKGVPGLHIYTMNRAPSTTRIITALREENLL